MKKTHQPKGSMCANCAHSGRDCSILAFNKMPVIERYADTAIVRCVEFSRKAAQAAADAEGGVR